MGGSDSCLGRPSGPRVDGPPVISWWIKSAGRFPAKAVVVAAVAITAVAVIDAASGAHVVLAGLLAAGRCPGGWTPFPRRSGNRSGSSALFGAVRRPAIRPHVDRAEGNAETRRQSVPVLVMVDIALLPTSGFSPVDPFAEALGLRPGPGAPVTAPYSSTRVCRGVPRECGRLECRSPGQSLDRPGDLMALITVNR